MIYYFDIDHTIAIPGGTPENGYKDAVGVPERIEKVNKLFDEGHKIIYCTARGTGSGIDYTDLTDRQLKKWGAKYHGIIFQRKKYDYFIDDKNISDKEFFNGC